MAIYYLTCANDWEADKIAKALLTKKLVACAKQMPVSSSSWWKGKLTEDKEILLVMESIEENFIKIEKEVRKLHSHETFVLYSTFAKTTKKVEEWIHELKCSKKRLA
jgi:periplasmic divalent cation tolerance protein